MPSALSVRQTRMSTYWFSPQCNSHYSLHTLNHSLCLILSHSSALLSGCCFPYGNINIFFSYQRFIMTQIRDIEKKRMRVSEGLKVRDGERAWGYFWPVWVFPTYTHACCCSERWVLYGWVLIWFDFTFWEFVWVCACVCVLSISLGFSCGSYGFLQCFERHPITPDILRV